MTATCHRCDEVVMSYADIADIQRIYRLIAEGETALAMDAMHELFSGDLELRMPSDERRIVAILDRRKDS